ncbi:hypothetical protein BUALT_Bualt19G0100800 [Buddleja alternifolia]|uniref:Phytosulfokine n=1 Tax=Buddleja alternifolia TaxID=168488 RepID=A0AAV6W8K3_9LAMI|nr:hypothetical protein BUALT_Bualt19G0100800 [Buddleja alternifolia]
MAKITSLCMLITFLLLLTLSDVLGRPEPTFHGSTPVETRFKDNEVYVGEESCDGIGEDECLMRRTLQAHIDYIYTQRQTQP